MTIWIVIIEDRHADVDVKPFSQVDWAIEEARQWASDGRDVVDEEITVAMAADGWVYSLRVGSEGDCARVVKRTLDG